MAHQIPVPRWLQRTLWLALLVLVPVAWLSMRYDPYGIDGDAVAYMDIADLIHSHQWAGVVNAYWHPLYPAVLLLAQLMFHPTRADELWAYYRINLGIFLLEAAAVYAFATAICRLRDAGMTLRSGSEQPAYLLSVDAVRLLGIGLLVIASQRELTMGKVRPDALLQALLLFAFSAMLTLCRPAAAAEAATTREAVTARAHLAGFRGRRRGVSIGAAWRYGAATVMGLALGFAYLTKSFAFLMAFLSIAAVAVVQWLWLRRPPAQVLALAALSAVCFAAVAGPYVAALSHQKHRLDFGDSGSLNYAWYVAHTEKMHLEPWQTDRFGSSTVHLTHPERQIMSSPGVFSYAALPYGTLPVWFDASFFNERIVTHIRPGQLVRRDLRNVQLVFRYLLNHPEAWLLLLLLLALGARWRCGLSAAPNVFLWLPLGLGVAIWCIYGLVNVEERYVTVGYLAIVLPAFAALCRQGDGRRRVVPFAPGGLAVAASACVALLTLLALGESVRIAAEQRRQESLRGLQAGWQDSPLFAVAAGLDAMHLPHGTGIACVGTIACLNDPYWMRLAHVRTTTEIYMDHDHVAEALAALPNRPAVYAALRAEGAPVLVGHFDPAVLLTSTLAGEGWQRLGRTSYYGLPLRQPNDSAGPAGERQQP